MAVAKTDGEKAIEILGATEDGDELHPSHLGLVQAACNRNLNEEGREAFHELYENVRDGYEKPWFHGIEHLTIDLEGFVKWKGTSVEHFDFPYAWSDEAGEYAEEVARRCRILEEKGEELNTVSVAWKWEG